MPPVSRAERVAKSLIESAGIRKPFVPVEKIAEKYAVIVMEEMPDDISGMLIRSSKRRNGPEVGDRRQLDASTCQTAIHDRA